jgi:hypothetical protein
MQHSLSTITILLSIVTSFGICSAAADESPYISPGVAVSWNISHGLVFGVKLSFGYAWNGRFANLTIGRAFCKTDDAYPFTYVQCQYGVQSRALEIRKTLPFCGGSFGVAIVPTDSGKVIVPHISAFMGFVLFVNVDVLLIKEARTAVGAELALPIPLKRIDFGRIGG